MMQIFKLALMSLCIFLWTITGFAQNNTNSDLLEQAKAFVQESDYDKALELYSLYLRFHTDDFDALSQRAVVYASLQDFENAFDDIDSAFEIAGFSATDQAVIYNNRGQIYFLQENWEQTLQDFSRAIELHPTFADYWLNRGILYQVQIDWDNALSDYEHYLTLSPNNSEVYLDMSRIYLSMQDLDSAIGTLTSAIDITPNDPELYIFRGSINLMREAYADAGVDYQTWMNLINISQFDQGLIAADSIDLTLSMSYGTLHKISFEADSGDRLGIVSNSSSVDSLIVLLDPKGKPIMADDDSGQGLNSFIIDFTLPEDGIYTVWVGHARGGWNGDIDLTIQIVEGTGI